MHYIVLLLKHGKTPYKQIYDLNMPGSYLTERWAIDIFGSGNLGWRLYEFTLLGLMTLAMIVIAKPYDWLAGLFSGVMFALLHGTEGPMNAAQRDEVLTVLVFVGFALLVVAIRHVLPVLMAGCGFALGIAILIKPTVLPLAFVLILVPIWVARRPHPSRWRYVLFGVAGLAVAFSLALQMLLPHHALGPFLFILERVVPYYATMAHPSFLMIFKASLPRTFLLYAPLAVLLALTSRQPADWTMWLIRAGVLFGAVSYFVQGKGYTYHRYLFLAFALLWIGLELTSAMRQSDWRRDAAAVGLAFAVLLMIPFNAVKVAHRQYTNVFADQLQRDLMTIGGHQLTGHAQCLDMVSGCFTAFYRLDIVQSTPFPGDTLFFATDNSSIVTYYRNIFWDEIHQNPPKVIVLGNEWYAKDTYSFNKLNAWPQFRDYLNSAYDLRFARYLGLFDGNEIAYRIYVLKDTAASGPVATLQ
jgi:hypothetical protein